MEEEWDELAGRAVRGDGEALSLIDARLVALAQGSRLRAKVLVQAIRGRSPLSGELRKQLRELGQDLFELGAPDFAEAVWLLATEQSGAARPEPGREDAVVELRSERERGFSLLRLDSELKLANLSRECDSGKLPCRLKVERNVSYILKVATDVQEPLVEIPLYVAEADCGLVEIDLDLSPWFGVGDNFIWLPRFSSIVGGDLAARDSLPLRKVDVGAIVVSKYQCRMREYLLALTENSSDGGIKKGYLPMEMGKSLVRRKNGGWEPLGLNIKKGHDWTVTPVGGVDLESALWYCSQYRLPDHLYADLLYEEEWEVLARGPERLLFPWGNSYVRGFANIRGADGTAESGVEAVGDRWTDRSRFGLYDCSGNAQEWCRLSEANGDEVRKFAVARGGSFHNPSQASRLASRVVRHSDYRHKKLTFRVAARPKSREGACVAGESRVRGSSVRRGEAR